jgi:myo-inositol-1-phosphate synthase
LISPHIGDMIHIVIRGRGCASMLVTGLDYGQGKEPTIQGRVYDDESYQVYGVKVEGAQWHHPKDHDKAKVSS